MVTGSQRHFHTFSSYRHYCPWHGSHWLDFLAACLYISLFFATRLIWPSTKTNKNRKKKTERSTMAHAVDAILALEHSRWMDAVDG